jgi:membrane fusion protein (multidrug efflux system)
VKTGEVLFQASSILYKAKLEAEMADLEIAKLEMNNTKKLFEQKVVTAQELAIYEAKFARAQAKAKFAEAELNFTTIRAPFDGLIGRLELQEGSLVKENDSLSTLSDNSVIWVYFHVPEARFLEYKAREGKSKDPSSLELVDSRIQLMLADGSTFKHDAGNIVTVESEFRPLTGTISFRADFPNPDRLLRNGQSGTVLIRRTVKNVLTIPQRATFEILDKRFVYVVGDDDLVSQREVVVEHETADTFVIKKGLDVNDRIVLEGVRRVRDGDKVESTFRKPEVPKGSPKIDGEK